MIDSNKHKKILICAPSNIATINLYERAVKEEIDCSLVISTKGKKFHRKDKDDFTFDELMIHWNQFAKDADEKNRKTLCTALTKTQPVLEDNYMIIHTLDNKPLYDNFNKEKQDFLDFLKKKLNNFSISIQSKLEKNENSEVFLYTDKEKFKKFAEQHPELLYLKEKLHLDFEF